MNRPALLAMIFFALAASLAVADDDLLARDIARKDFDKTMAKITDDDKVATQKCRNGTGAAVDACLIQTRGKRVRGEQEAKAKLNRVALKQPVSDTQAKADSTTARKSAQRDQRSTAKEIDVESKAAAAECKKLSGMEKRTCIADVDQRRNEARDLADAMYKKARSEAKGIKGP